MIEEWRLYYGHVKFWKQVPVLRLLLEYIYKKRMKKTSRMGDNSYLPNKPF